MAELILGMMVCLSWLAVKHQIPVVSVVSFRWIWYHSPMSNPTDEFGVLGMMANGDADWLQNVMVPLHEGFRDLPHFKGEFPTSCRQRHTRSEAMNTYFGVAIAAIGFYALKKVTDDFYDVIVKPRVRKVFEALDKKFIPANNKAKKVLILSVWYEQYDLVVSVSVVGEDFDKIITQLDQVGVVQRSALAQVAAAGVLAPVHHYTIEDGKVNTEPELFERVDELLLRRE
ncbi:MAG TPA: hypothetical protein VK815_00015 [Candidatus Acidoferrales bacterium]|jgi:hypothetical protein|nr:hypothetical protein [Candidatus Acidoferrales bacterium]